MRHTRTPDFADPAVARRFLTGPAAAAARTVIDTVGILNLRAEGFDAIVDGLFGNPPCRTAVLALVDELSGRAGADRKRGQDLDADFLDALHARAETAYLLGLAVGQRIGGAR